IAEAFFASLVDLLPDRLVAVRVVDSAEPTQPAASAPLQGPVVPAAYPHGARPCLMDGAVDGIDVPAAARGNVLALITVERQSFEGDPAADQAVAQAVAPFLANALRTA